MTLDSSSGETMSLSNHTLLTQYPIERNDEYLQNANIPVDIHITEALLAPAVES